MARNGNYVVEEPYRHCPSITPSDTTVLAVTDAIWCNTAGNLVVTMADGVDQTFAMNAGSGLDIAVTKVKAASTGSYVAMYR